MAAERDMVQLRVLCVQPDEVHEIRAESRMFENGRREGRNEEAVRRHGAGLLASMRPSVATSCHGIRQDEEIRRFATIGRNGARQPTAAKDKSGGYCHSRKCGLSSNLNSLFLISRNREKIVALLYRSDSFKLL